jgi:hypothetical protein
MQKQSAKGAEYESQGQVQAKQGTSPLVTELRGPAALKGRNRYFGLSGHIAMLIPTSGDVLASLALAPGFHISRRWRLFLIAAKPTQTMKIDL